MTETTDDVQAVETETAPNGAKAVETETTSRPVPAVKPEVSEREKLLADWNRTKDQEISRKLREQEEVFRRREIALRTKARNVVSQHDEQAARQLDSELENESVIEQARAIVQKETAAQESRRMANEIAGVFGLRGDDPRLLNAQDWADFRAKAKAAAADDARKERESAKQAEEVKARKAVDQRVDSGELSSLDIKPSGAKLGTLEEEYKREAAKIPRGQVKAFTELKFKYRKKGLAI